MELVSLKPIASVDDAKEIIEALQGDQVKLWVEQYKNNPIKEMYGTGVMTEILNRLCIQLGYNPLRATKALQAFTTGER